MKSERRRSQRFPVGFYMTQIINNYPHRCFTTDLSAIGLYVERLVEPFERNTNIVQLELPLPSTGEAIWAKGEVIYDSINSVFHGSAIRFLAMARKHQRLIREWLREVQRNQNRVYQHLNERKTEKVIIVRPNKCYPRAA